MIKDLGARVASIWENLRPVTRKMIIGALEPGTRSNVSAPAPRFFYDAQADWELTRLLSALDEESTSKDSVLDASKRTELSQLAESCARVLESQSASAEVFILLATRALRENDFKRLDKLSDTLAERYSAGEIAEVIRQAEYPQLRAIAMETLAMFPIPSVVQLLGDPLYADIAVSVLEQKAYEFDSESAREMLDRYDEYGPTLGE